MEVVWAPWRMQYILGEKPMGCFLCKAVTNGVSKTDFVLQSTDHSLVLLNRYPYISGHLMVVPHRHISGLDELTGPEMADLQETLRKTISIVRKVLSPDGINVGMNLGKAAGAGLEDHIHWHVIPRFHGDTNSFTVLTESRVIPESLEDTYQRFITSFQQ